MTQMREEWLSKAVSMIDWQIFEPTGRRMPEKWRVSCSFPHEGGLRKRNRTLGQCWSASASRGGVIEMLISPVLDNAEDVLGVLAHEMVHAIVGVEKAHRRSFQVLARAIGLDGPATSTTPGDGLKHALLTIALKLGAYPHDALQGAPGKEKKKQSARMIKLECPECSYTIRTTRKWIDKGLPVCPCGATFAGDLGEEDDPDQLDLPLTDDGEEGEA